MAGPARGEVWMVDLDPARGHEQAGRRPALVVSVDPFNHGPAGLVMVPPITSKAKSIPLHVQIKPPEGGVKSASYIKCENVRSVAKERLARRMGVISPTAQAEVDDRLHILLGL